MSIIKKLAGIFKCRKAKKFTSAIIVAGGSGTRLGSEIPKQHLLLDGCEVVVHSMLAFEKSGLVDEIIVVCRRGEEGLYDSYKEKYNIRKLKVAVEGGSVRSESALRGFEAISPESKYVAIHDAARCLVSVEDIDKVIRTAYKYRCATAAIKCTDTVKLCDSDGFIKETLDREKLYLAATPQVFERKIYMTCAYSAKKDQAVVTDDNSLAERLGFKVKLVDCMSTKIKITHPDDLIIAEGVIRNSLQ